MADYLNYPISWRSLDGASYGQKGERALERVGNRMDVLMYNKSDTVTGGAQTSRRADREAASNGDTQWKVG